MPGHCNCLALFILAGEKTIAVAVGSLNGTMAHRLECFCNVLSIKDTS